MTPAGLAQLRSDEGLRLLVYDDASGAYIRRGPGGGNPTIGFGRNLFGRGITEAEAEYLLENDIAGIWRYLMQELPWITNTPDVRQNVVTWSKFAI